jgi:hypothetical protein
MSLSAIAAVALSVPLETDGVGSTPKLVDVAAAIAAAAEIRVGASCACQDFSTTAA